MSLVASDRALAWGASAAGRWWLALLGGGTSSSLGKGGLDADLARKQPHDRRTPSCFASARTADLHRALPPIPPCGRMGTEHGESGESHCVARARPDDWVLVIPLIRRVGELARAERRTSTR